MYFSEWEQNDGYVECIASLEKDLAPLFKVRCVVTGEGFFAPMVRDYVTGYLLASGEPLVTKTLEACKPFAIELTNKFMLKKVLDVEKLCMRCLKKLVRENLL